MVKKGNVKIFSQSSFGVLEIQGPIEAAVGISFGLFWGLLSAFFPGKDDANKDLGRLVVLLGGALLAMFGSSAKGVDLPGSGALVNWSLFLNWHEAYNSEVKGPEKLSIMLICHRNND